MSIRETIQLKKRNVINIYLTAGFPSLNSTVDIIKILSEKAVDLIELGMPYSDPLADGPTIQQSNEAALRNGQTIKLLFSQVTEVRKYTSIPIIIMGYYNQMLQYGEETFLAAAQKAGVNGLIIPDLPMDIYEAKYQAIFEKYDIEISFLVTPMTSDERIQQADRLSSGFIYIVSQSSITGKKGSISDEQIRYFDKIKDMKLNSPTLIGFGIHDSETFNTAASYSNGGIIGSAFIRALAQKLPIQQIVNDFIDPIQLGIKKTNT